MRFLGTIARGDCTRGADGRCVKEGAVFNFILGEKRGTASVAGKVIRDLEKAEIYIPDAQYFVVIAGEIAEGQYSEIDR